MQFVKFFIFLGSSFFLLHCTNKIPAKTVESCESRPKALAFARFFQTHMVLHEKRPRIWGRGRPHSKVKISLENKAGSEIEVPVSADGRWLAEIPMDPIPQGETTLLAKDGCEEINVPHVLIGEVWLCSGQSNMTWDISVAQSGPEIREDVKNEDVKKQIRILNIEQKKATSPLDEIDDHYWGPLHDDGKDHNVHNFSATCYHMGREIQKKIKKPIGLIHSTHGGSDIAYWIPRELIPKYEDPPEMLENSKNNGRIYNALIAPFKNLRLSGVAWYQGESNVLQPWHYGSLQNILIDSWRDVFKDKDLPFYIVQIANIGGTQNITPDAEVSGDEIHNDQAQIRQDQYRGAHTIKNTWMVTAVDVATPEEAKAFEIHPINKKPVGTRLARSILFHTYHIGETPFPEWIYSELKKNQDGSLEIAIEFPPSVPLPALQKDFPGFVLKDSTNQRYFYASSARIVRQDKKKHRVWIRVKKTGLTEPSELRYGWAQNPVLSLYAGKDPLPPICIFQSKDQWQLCEELVKKR